MARKGSKIMREGKKRKELGIRVFERGKFVYKGKKIRGKGVKCERNSL